MKQRKGERKGREESRERKEQGRIDHCHHRHNTTNHVITTTSSPPRRLTSVITATTFLPYDHHTHHYITITSAGDHSTTIIVMTGDHNREEREREKKEGGPEMLRHPRGGGVGNRNVSHSFLPTLLSLPQSGLLLVRPNPCDFGPLDHANHLERHFWSEGKGGRRRQGKRTSRGPRK
jgi:hypothetical protein